MTQNMTPGSPETGPGDDPIARLKAGLDADELFAMTARLPQKHRDQMLREVAAKREILDLWESVAEPIRCTGWDSGYSDGQMAALKPVIAALAAVYVPSGSSHSTT